MNLPVEVLLIIFSFLHPNDLIEISAMCKLFYQLSRKNGLSFKTFTVSERLFHEKKWLCEDYYDRVLCFSNRLCTCLKGYDVNEDSLHLPKNVILNRVFHSILPLHVWNHLFLCSRNRTL